MSGLRFVLTMAWRETRGARRRQALLAATIAVGVAALVAINSFTDSMQRSVRGRARELLGADLSVQRSTPFSEELDAEVAILAREAGLPDATPGPDFARRTLFTAMARRSGGERASLVQVTALEGGFPFYGNWRTEPPGQWPRLSGEEEVAIVEPTLLTNLGARLGDELALGEARFTIVATVHDIPGDISVLSSLGPRVYIPAHHLEATRLLGFGSRAGYRADLRIGPGIDPERLGERWEERLAPERVRLRTAGESEGRLDRQLGRLGRYLGLVALVALLLGGVGVASAVHVFIQRKLETVAVLRCLGASTRQVLAIYLLQAAALGVMGSLAGILVGNAVQLALPRLAEGLLPVDVVVSPSPAAMLGGLAVGLAVALLFSVLPLLGIRDVSPLAVLRAPGEAPPVRRDPARLLALSLLAIGTYAIAALQASDLFRGLVFTAGLGAVLALLTLAAAGLVRAARRFLPARLPYVWRQGLANLHRPANQTLTVILALGFGAFLLSTLYLVQANLLLDLRVDADPNRPNLVFIDVQPDQRDGLVELLGGISAAPPPTPIVTMRILEVQGQPVRAILGTSEEVREIQGRGDRWAFRREYRSSYRDVLSASERVVAGEHWRPGEWRDRDASQPVPVSLEEGVAEELGVGVGDVILWDVQGLPMQTRVVSLREVQWARFEPNFFALFPEGPLDRAPQTFVALSRVGDAGARAQLQRRVVERFPNVTSIDLASVQATLEDLIAQVAIAVRLTASFSLIAGLAVLAGAVAASRLQRVRESVLLKVLGASRSQVLRVLFSEYLALGLLASLTAALLAIGSGWGLTELYFDASFRLPLVPLFALSLGVTALTVFGGLAASLEQLRKTPLEALRAE